MRSLYDLATYMYSIMGGINRINRKLQLKKNGNKKESWQETVVWRKDLS